MFGFLVEACFLELCIKRGREGEREILREREREREIHLISPLFIRILILS